MAWNDSLDDFERQLAADKRKDEAEAQAEKRSSRDDRRHRHSSHHHRHSHRSSRHHDEERDEDGHRHKRRRRSHDRDEEEEEEDRDRERRRRHRHRDDRDSSRRRDGSRRRKHRDEEERGNDPAEGDGEQVEEVTRTSTSHAPALKRDAWMEAPSALEVEYKHKPAASTQTPLVQPGSQSPRAKFDSKIHDAELSKHHLDSQAEDGSHDDEGHRRQDLAAQPASHEVNYEFGDSGSQWRMTRLKGVYRQADESAVPLEEVALKQYGDLRSFDDAREEEIELDRRDRYGSGYVGKIRPSGELFQERKLDVGVHRAEDGGSGRRFEGSGVADDQEDIQQKAGDRTPRIETMAEVEPPARSVALDSTALNRLRAKMMKAKLKGLPEAEELEREYEAASQASQSGTEDGVVVLGTMDNRMLAGGRKGEVKEVTNRRGRERGNVEENEDMSIDDMVREERRTKGLFGNEGERLAERIAKDSKFDNDLDYMDENATKLAKRVHKSDAALRNSAIANHKLTNSVLSSCPLCHHEDRPADPLPTAPTVSMAHRSYLTLATAPEISSYGCAVIVPIAHHSNLLHCDDDEWEEIRNFQKSLVRMFHERDLGVLFYENAAHPRKQRHAALVAVAVPLGLADDAPAFFREAILASDDEWTQHRKLIPTTGKGKNGFRRTLSKEVPYFHVWTEIDGGLGHVVEDDRKWPQGDLFAREILGGMLRVKPEIWRKQGRWERGADTAARVEKFRKGWRAYDWTRMLVEGGEAV